MLPARLPASYTGAANVIAVLILLAEFGMFRAGSAARPGPPLRGPVRADRGTRDARRPRHRHLPELYVLAGVTIALKVVGDPARCYGGCSADRSLCISRTPAMTSPGTGGLGLASTVLIGIVVAAFGFFSAGALPVSGGGAPATALSVSISVVLVAFVLMIHRRDVASQAIGLFSLENGISLAALVVAASLPLILEVALLFDLLLAVVVFGLLIRLHHGRAETLSTSDLTELRG